MNIKMKKSTAFLMLIIMLSVIFTGCAGGGASGKPAPAGQNQIQSEANKDISGEVVFWNYDTDYFQALADNFNKKFPNIKINLVPVDGAEYFNKWLTSYSAGTDISDIGVLEETIFARMGNIKGAWEDLSKSPYNININDILDGYKPLAINDAGEVVGINEAVTSSGFAYKRDMAKTYLGVSEPDEVGKLLKTWDDYYNLSVKVYTESDGKDFLFPCIADLGAIIVNQKGVAIIDKDANIDTQAITDVFTKLLKLKSVNAYDPQIPETSDPSYNATFSDGHHMFFGCPPWMIRYVIKLNDENGSGNWGLISAPERGYCWGGTGFSVYSGSKNKMATFTFLKECYFTVEGGEFYKQYTGGEIIPYKPFATDLTKVSNIDPYFANQDVGKTIMGWMDEPGSALKPASKYDGVMWGGLSEGERMMINGNPTVDELVSAAVAYMKENIPLVG